MHSTDMRARVFVLCGVVLSIVLVTLAFGLIVPELFAENYSPVNIHKGIGVSILAAASIRMTVFLFKKNGGRKSLHNSK